MRVTPGAAVSGPGVTIFFNMKKLWIWILLAAAAVAWWYYQKAQASPSSATQAAATAAGASNQNVLQSFLGQFGTAANQQNTDTLTSAWNNLQSISGAFGGPTTGNGVPIGGNSVQTVTSGNGPAVAVDNSGLGDSDSYGGDDGDE